VRGVHISQELRDNGGFGDDFAVVGERGDEAAGVDGEVFGGAGDGEVDVHGFEFNADFFDSDLSAVSPGALVGCVKDDLWWRFVGSHFDI